MGSQQDDGHGAVELPRASLNEAVGVPGPGGAFEEDAGHVGTIVRRIERRELCVSAGALELHVSDDPLQAEGVDLYSLSPSVVLQDRGQESLGEEEAGEPEGQRRTIIDPALEGGEPAAEVGDKASQASLRRVRDATPAVRDLAEQDRGKVGLRGGRGDLLAAKCLEEAREAGSDALNERIEAL